MSQKCIITPVIQIKEAQDLVNTFISILEDKQTRENQKSPSHMPYKVWLISSLKRRGWPFPKVGLPKDFDITIVQ